MLSSNSIQRLLKNSVWPQLSSALIDNRSLTPEQTVGMYLTVKQGEDYDYFATRKMGHQLLTSPYETTWWNSSKYRLCLDRFDPLPRDARVLDVACGLGQASYFLAERVAEVTGVDLSSFAIQFAKKTLSQTQPAFCSSRHFCLPIQSAGGCCFLYGLTRAFQHTRGTKCVATNI